MKKNNDKLVSALGNFTDIFKDLVEALNEDRDNINNKLSNTLSIIEEQLIISKETLGF
jgi:ABC-type transporter Mla subunit MlaD